ncbi:Rpb7-binding protein seb1 [Colletotrichum spaethianum]|uniref:Rpb7-binding protein seb1 n=1 Tax=Colletotrichum spaethianum TaxID=700344 RepID=A0AA37L0R0_9PEZI|nr:Rpb7-binding protein seb1 [Colletotrichum spaethianum]GKT39838.1 Rpb7-binding protein seb1 [Colletotrichum spaethianum]
MATLLRDPNIDNYDIIAIQEPWRNPFNATTHHPAKDRFHLCYPSNEERGPARVCFFINKKLDHSRWQFKESSRDLCTVSIGTGEGNEPPTVIHNIYNPSLQEDNRPQVLQQLRKSLETHQHGEQIVAGDFNLHHELWGGSNIRARDREATELLDLMDDMNLTSQLQPGTVTYEEGNRRTTIDLCLVTVGLVDRIIRCEVDHDINHDSDHLPIVTSLHLAVAELHLEKKRNWKAIDEKTFIQTFRASLPQLQRPRTKTALDGYVEATVEAISTAIEASVPAKAPSPKSRTGWTEECAYTLAEAKRLRRVYSEQQTEESWEAYKEARNRKGRVIRKALQRAHREAVETAAGSPASLWRIAKWARYRQDQSPTVTPEIKKPNTTQVATTPGEKAALFKETFFPPPPEANLGDIDNASYSNQIILPLISESEVEEAIQEAAPLKAPGPDGVTNKALQIARQINTGIPQGSPLSPILYLFYNADLLDSCNEAEGTTATGFIDDVAILAVGDNTEDTCQKLQEALRKAERWAFTHASVFAPEKFQLTHFTRAKTRINTDTTLQSQWGEIRPKTTCKYLGLIMDSSLKWKQHIDETERKPRQLHMGRKD